MAIRWARPPPPPILTYPIPTGPLALWRVSVAAGLISGYSDGTFRPASSITLAEGATIALGLLGYSAEDYSGAYPSPQMALYHSLSLDKGLTAQAASAPPHPARRHVPVL